MRPNTDFLSISPGRRYPPGPGLGLLGPVIITLCVALGFVVGYQVCSLDMRRVADLEIRADQVEHSLVNIQIEAENSDARISAVQASRSAYAARLFLAHCSPECTHEYERHRQ